LTLGLDQAKLLLVVFHPGSSCPHAIFGKVLQDGVIKHFLGLIGVVKSECNTAHAIAKSGKFLPDGEGDKNIRAEGMAGSLIDSDHGEIFGQDHGFHLLDVVDVLVLNIDVV